MSNADLAITAGGSITWEKCTLGLPSLVSIDGENQLSIASKMNEIGTQRTLGLTSELTSARYVHELNVLQQDDLKKMADSALVVCDGRGASRVLTAMERVE